jgi:hypothetical protein
MDNRDRVRLLIPDNDEQHFIFSNVQIDEFLAMEENSVKLATAQCLDVIASSEALTLKVIKLLDLQTDGAKLSAELRARAKGLREQAEEEDFDIYEVYEDDDEVEESE